MAVHKLPIGQDVEEGSWPNHSHRPGIYPVGLRKIMKSFSQDCHLQDEICNPEILTPGTAKPAALFDDIECN
jgi:hypothetical protein